MNPDRVRCTVLDFRSASPSQLREAQQEMLTIIEDVFDGPGMGDLRKRIETGTGIVWVARYHDGERIVGFALVVLDELSIDGRSVLVARALTGFRSAWRGGQRVMPFFVRCGMLLLLDHPRRELWTFIPALHVSSYRLLAKHVPAMDPHPARPLSPERRTWLEKIAEAYKCQREPGDHPLVCRRGMLVRAADAPPPSPREPDDLDRYFYSINPHHAQGGCVMILAPINLSNVLGTARSWLRTRAHRLWRDRRPREAHTSPLSIA